MCGIVGYIGPKDPVEVLVDGLRRLEYRGYDSAGRRVRGRRGKIVRSAGAPGKLPDLEEVIAGVQPLTGTLRRGPYALGDPRATLRGECPPAPRLHGSRSW